MDDKRRSGPRSVICLPVSVRFSDNESPRPVHLRDMSAAGIAIFSDFIDLNPSAQIEVIVSVPYEISLTEEIQVRFGGEVMRVDNDTQNRRSIAAALFPISSLGHA